MKKILPGGITYDILDRIEKPEVVQVLVQAPPQLIVIENGDTRLLRISRSVAEVLVAWGMPYGN